LPAEFGDKPAEFGGAMKDGGNMEDAGPSATSLQPEKQTQTLSEKGQTQHNSDHHDEATTENSDHDEATTVTVTTEKRRLSRENKKTKASKTDEEKTSKAEKQKEAKAVNEETKAGANRVKKWSWPGLEYLMSIAAAPNVLVTKSKDLLLMYLKSVATCQNSGGVRQVFNSVSSLQSFQSNSSKTLTEDSSKTLTLFTGYNCSVFKSSEEIQEPSEQLQDLTKALNAILKVANINRIKRKKKVLGRGEREETSSETSSEKKSSLEKIEVEVEVLVGNNFVGTDDRITDVNRLKINTDVDGIPIDSLSIDSDRDSGQTDSDRKESSVGQKVDSDRIDKRIVITHRVTFRFYQYNNDNHNDSAVLIGNNVGSNNGNDIKGTQNLKTSPKKTEFETSTVFYIYNIDLAQSLASRFGNLQNSVFPTVRFGPNESVFPKVFPNSMETLPMVFPQNSFATVFPTESSEVNAETNSVTETSLRVPFDLSQKSKVESNTGQYSKRTQTQSKTQSSKRMMTPTMMAPSQSLNAQSSNAQSRSAIGPVSTPSFSKPGNLENIKWPLNITILDYLMRIESLVAKNQRKLETFLQNEVLLKRCKSVQIGDSPDSSFYDNSESGKTSIQWSKKKEVVFSGCEVDEEEKKTLMIFFNSSSSTSQPRRKECNRRNLNSNQVKKSRESTEYQTKKV